MLSGRAWTEAIIAKHDIRDSGGRLHSPYGIMTWDAKVVTYVTFDQHHEIGRRAFYLGIVSLRREILRLADDELEPPKRGSLDSNGASNTGAGYLIGMNQVDVVLSKGIGLPGADEEDDKRAVAIVREQMIGWGWQCRNANLHEQKSGIDLVASGAPPLSRMSLLLALDEIPIEVKSRAAHQKHDKIFVQISETNTDKKH